MKQPLKITPRAIRALQTKHGISNLLQPTAADGEKMATVDFLVDFTYEGSRSWDQPPAVEAVEEIEIGEMLTAVKAALSGESPGKD